mmetsp:Transcript_623/g.520  ORF Transcript_623/g.520 Transcript_623/m.520 type:complete len:379 (-) Transcript_623:23-1159(-)
MGALFSRGSALPETGASDFCSKATHCTCMLVDKSECGDLYELTHGNLKVTVLTFGATITSVRFPSKRSGFSDHICLGFDRLQQYADGCEWMGATVGRVANVITKGTFSIGSDQYSVSLNDGPNHLHGGGKGFSSQRWDAKIVTLGQDEALSLELASPDGHEGYPGNVTVQVQFSLPSEDQLRIEYAGQSDKETPLNVSNHSYWNLLDAGRSTVADHTVKINADEFTAVDEETVLNGGTGQVWPVSGDMDLRTEKRIGDALCRKDQMETLLKSGGGYDHNFILKKPSAETEPAATVTCTASGRGLSILTSEPGLQFYTANFLPEDALVGRAGVEYRKYHAFCLEAQHFPDSPNNHNFPSIMISPECPYHQVTVYKFFHL